MTENGFYMLSTISGKKKRRGEPDDARAAAVILQSYLDARAFEQCQPYAD